MDPSINPFLSTTLPSSIGVNAPQGLPPSADAVAAARQPGFGSTSTLASTSASSGSTAAASTAAAPTIPSDAPGKALEPLTEGAGVSGAGGIFDKALGMAMPVSLGGLFFSRLFKSILVLLADIIMNFWVIRARS